MELDEIELAKQAINGNEAAQLQLLNLYKEPMYRIAYSYMQNEHDANDALQEMTYQCLKNIHKVQTPQYFKTWLVRIVINTCLMMKRQQKRIVVTNNLLEKSWHMAELFELNDVISHLPMEQQELIHLKYFKDLKNSEIATIQKIPEGTVKSRLHKTLKKLRHLLGEGGIS
jgi:RNA polymerase sigma factor (sigma-70 family)